MTGRHDRERNDGAGTRKKETKKPVVRTVPVRTWLSTAVSSISQAVAKALVMAEKCLRTRLAARPPVVLAVGMECGWG